MPELKHRIGQVIWPALRASRGEGGLDALTPLIEQYPPGGVIVFGEGANNVEQLIAALRLRCPKPLLIAADLERGCGQQIQKKSTLPSAMALAATGSPENAREAGLLTAIEARQAGIDVVFAPVADVNTAATNPIIATRSFGDDPLRVASFASAFAQGLQDGGCLAVAKHFPGHGSTIQDSHSERPRLTRNLSEMESIDLAPFRTLIAENIGGLMVGHLEVPALDPVPGRPATTSPNIILDYLRHRLGYSGLVVTDAMDMGGFPQEEAAALDVLQSGIDVLLMPSDPLACAQSLEKSHGVYALPDEVLDGAVQRIEAAQKSIPQNPPKIAAPISTLGERLMADAMTLLHGPLPEVSPGMAVDTLVFGEEERGPVAGCWEEALEGVGHIPEPGGVTVGLVITSVAAHLGSSRLSSRDRERLEWNLAQNRLDALVILGSPYEALEAPDTVPVLVAYEPSPEAARQAAMALVGRHPTPGVLPLGSSGVLP